MSQKNLKAQETAVARWVTILFGFPWLEVVAELWKISRKLWRGLANEGIYEVLEHEATLELLDKLGKRARVHKRQRVRYLQNEVASYLDQAWGDGEFLINYRCAPGKEVDRYVEEHKTYVLISLRGRRKRGDEDEIDIEWEFHNSFLESTNQWTSEVSHRTKLFTIQLIFPKSRPPQRVWKNEYIRKQSFLLEQDAMRKLPDGRWLISWKVEKPQLNEHYSLKWDW
jgi:hypothetical protein